MILSTLLKTLPSHPVYAHCDIPCGLYDPADAQMAAQTVLVMVQKINELKVPGDNEKDDWKNYKNSLTRMIMNKEEHAKLCEKELVTLWVDYFKEEHLEKFPDLHETFWKACKLCAKNMQNVDKNLANQLVEAVDRIAEMFKQTKK